MRFIKIKIFFYILLLTTCFQGFSGNKNSKFIWETNFFTGNPMSVIEQSNKIKINEDDVQVKVFLKEVTIKIDNENKVEKHFKWVYKILDQKGIDNWSDVQSSFSPWYQNKPEIRVRIISPEGKESFIDEKSLIENSAEKGSDKIYSDRKVLSAPFKGIVVGSIVEQEVVIKEHKPFFNKGRFIKIYPTASVPLEKFKATFIFPKDLAYKYKVFKFDELKPEIIKENDEIKLFFEAKNVKKDDKFVYNLPFDQLNYPIIAFSTVDSWESLAKEYNFKINNLILNAKLTKYSQKLKKENIWDTCNSILAWMREKIRYTGLELGENSIVPYDLEKVVDRGYGDCKDKATLFVGLLRDMGYEADVVLIKVGSYFDVISDFLGMEQFDHSIVCVYENNQKYFIDPTASMIRAKYLPNSDCSRNVLIINEKTKNLEKTPDFKPLENKIIQTREIFLKDFDYGDLIETTKYFGDSESNVRLIYSGISNEDLKKHAEKYIKTAYRFGDFVSFKTTDPMDFSENFTITLKAKKIGRANTEGSTAAVALMQENVLAFLPSVFKSEQKKERKNDFQFRNRINYVLKHIIHPPVGFELVKLPENEKVDLGCGTIEKSFQVGADGNILSTISYLPEKMVLTPEEYKNVNEKVMEFLKNPSIILNLKHKGLALIEKEKYKEGFKFFKELIEKYPKNILNYIHFSRALLKAGMGEAARETLHKALKVDDKNAKLYGMLGWVYQHDLIGRRFGKGFDYEKSVKYYIKAIELDDKEWIYPADLAILYEHDKLGFRYSNKANLKEALKYYKLIEEKYEKDNLKGNVPYVYIYLDDFKGLLEYSDSIEKEYDKNYYKVLATSVLEGSEKAIELSNKLFDKEESLKSLNNVVNILVAVRKYKVAARLLKEIAKHSDKGVQIEKRVETLENIVKFEDFEKYKGQPQSVIIETFLKVINSDGENFDQLKSIYADGVFDFYTTKSKEQGFTKQYIDFSNIMKAQGFRPHAFSDIIISSSKFSVETDKDNGYFVTFWNAESNNSKLRYFIVKKGDKFNIVATDFYLDGFGEYVLDLLEQNKVEAAKIWLKWFYKYYNYSSDNVEDPLDGALFGKFYNSKTINNVKFLKYAAAVMVKSSKDKKIENLMKEGYEENKNSEYGIYFLKYLTEYYGLNKNSEKAVKYSDLLLNKIPNSKTAIVNSIFALVQKGNYDRALTLAKKLIEIEPDDYFNYYIINEVYSLKGDLSEMEKILEIAEEKGLAKPMLYNQYCWMLLFEEKVPDSILNYAIKSLDKNGRASAATMHTIASVFAEIGRLDDAIKVLHQELDSYGILEPESNEWFVVGRIAENYGLKEVAKKIYKRVEKPKDVLKVGLSSYALAQKRLKILNNN